MADSAVYEYPPEDEYGEAPEDAKCWACGRHKEEMWYRGIPVLGDLMSEQAEADEVALGVDFYVTALEVMQWEVWECDYDGCEARFHGPWRMLFEPRWESVPVEFRPEIANRLIKDAVQDWEPDWEEDLFEGIRDRYAERYGSVPSIDKKFLSDRIDACHARWFMEGITTFRHIEGRDTKWEPQAYGPWVRKEPIPKLPVGAVRKQTVHKSRAKRRK